jgi:hypothetical protein
MVKMAGIAINTKDPSVSKLIVALPCTPFISLKRPYKLSDSPLIYKV